ncbi:MAG TPA: protein kinase [Kofleriaceae bacterium]|nr:protein kinase [Kofleriaceae bacterium]
MTAELVAADRLIGQTLADRYQVLHRLGEGAMGVVYKARHVKVGRPFAVKVLHSRLLQDTKVAQRFDREAELAGRLRHANVVGVVDVGEVDGLHYMVMDFAEGPDLAQLLVEAPMPPARIIHLARQMLEGLYHAHEQGLIHRDFKPENVIIERDSHGAEQPRIVDFGIAILRDGGESTDGQGRLTTNGLVLGTPHYMAPEQAVADPIDHRIDLFALGIVVYEMLSGRLPFDGSGAEVARANLLIDPPLISKRVPHLEVDPLLETFARRLMSKKPKDRPATAKAARELLDLISQDRAAAAVALGIAGAGSRAPAETEQLESQARPPLVFEPEPTRQLRATPSPLESVPPSYLQPRAPTPLPMPGYDATPMAMPLAYSAPHPQAVPELAMQQQTSVRMPLSWPGSSPAKHRRPWIIIGVGAGSIGVAIGAILALSGTKPAAVPDDHVVAIQGEPAPATVPPDPPAPPATNPTVTEPTTPPAGPPSTAAPPAPGPSASSGPSAPSGPPGAASPAVPGGQPATPSTPRAVTQVPRTASPARPVATPPAHPPQTIDPPVAHPLRASEVPPPIARPATLAISTGSAAHPAAKPATASLAGISGNDLWGLWVAVGTMVTGAPGKKLPEDKRQELKRRYTLIQIQPLMGAPQADRDSAARTLQDIEDQLGR